MSCLVGRAAQLELAQELSGAIHDQDTLALAVVNVHVAVLRVDGDALGSVLLVVGALDLEQETAVVGELLHAAAGGEPDVVLVVERAAVKASAEELHVPPGVDDIALQIEHDDRRTVDPGNRGPCCPTGLGS